MRKIKQIFISALSLIILHRISILVLQTDKENYSNHLSTSFQHEKVVIGIVYCRKPETSLLKDIYFEQTIVLLKSVLISAHLNNIPKLEIHLFLEHVKDDQSYFQKEILQEMAIPGTTVSLQIYSAVDAVPQKYRAHMLYHVRFRCGYVRFFFPDVLPNVDSIIHLDSDMIITGNLSKHWETLSQMDHYQMVAMTRDTPPNNKISVLNYNYIFGKTPHIPPRGFNAGLLIMNLTRMRKYKMSEKVIRIYKDYSKSTKVLSGQRIFNILLYFNPDILLSIPCNLNFMGPECENGKFYCEAALEDPEGIHMVHGTNHRFMDAKVFQPIYKFYKKFNISTVSNSTKIITSLIQPIKQAYSSKDGKNSIKCSGTLDKALFKNII